MPSGAGAYATGEDVKEAESRMQADKDKEPAAEDFVFRFTLEELAEPGNEADPLVEMVRRFLTDVQQIGYLCVKGRRVYVDGFVLNNQADVLHEL